MRLFLAPMEGVVDHHFRNIITAMAGVDICVTEFVRVTDRPVPTRVFWRLCPELQHNSQTRHGTTVRVQILGGKPEPMAQSALKAAELGAAGIDINFGCPAKMVNRNDGGSILLREPQRMYDIVNAVRKAVPDNIPVTAKIRLGFDSREGYLDTSKAVADAGANELFVHARSKVDGYRPPAYWDAIAEIRHVIDIPVIANGEIWTVDDWKNCKEQSGSTDFMLGRGIITRPDLASQIRAAHNNDSYRAKTWVDVLPLVHELYCHSRDAYGTKDLGARVKQWLQFLRKAYPEAAELYPRLKTFRQESEFNAEFEKQFSQHQAIPLAS